MNQINELEIIINKLAGIKLRVDQTNEIALPPIECLNRLVSVRNALIEKEKAQAAAQAEPTKTEE